MRYAVVAHVTKPFDVMRCGSTAERLSLGADRGGSGLTVTASGDARPVLAPNALGEGIPGVQFDGSSNTLTFAETDIQTSDRSVFWVGRAPWMPAPVGPPPLNPSWTVIGTNWTPMRPESDSETALSGTQTPTARTGKPTR